MQSTLPMSPPGPPHNDDECPFCADPDHRNLHTKHGEMKDEGVLAKNLASDTDVSNDDEVGAVYPIAGGSDKTDHWSVAAGVFEDMPTRIAAAPHHIIPGDAAMAKVEALEQWTTASKGGVIKEDIGYNIDCAKNGVFLPRYPDIFGTKHVWVTDAAGNPQDKGEGREYFGRTWSDLNDDEKKKIGFEIMAETFLQIHHTDHRAGYLTDKKRSYDKDARAACQSLADIMAARRAMCPKNQSKPYEPPYDLVVRINSESTRLLEKISGNPTWWQAWVTRLANQFSVDLKADKVRLRSRFGISRVYK